MASSIEANGPCFLAPLAMRIFVGLRRSYRVRQAAERWPSSSQTWQPLQPAPATSLPTARATYFPTMSHSRFTRSPTRSDDRFVCAQVNGMIMHVELRRRRSAATVRLMPSTATDPFAIEQRRQRARETRSSASARRPPRRTSSTVPSRVHVALDEVAAEPAVGPHRPLEVDRLHRGRSAPSVVTRAVSGPMSACTRSPRPLVTVRHTPLTARLSPSEQLGGQRASECALAYPAAAGVTPLNVARRLQ